LTKELKKTDTWDHEAELKKALQERDDLLKKRPELVHLQKEIDHRLTSTESFEERMRILGKMLGTSLEKLYNECSTLADICDHCGIETQIPILELKKKSAKLEFPVYKNQLKK